MMPISSIFFARSRPRTGRAAFTLTELLIVIGIMVLMLVLAIPTMSLLSGSRSIGAAQNQVNAMLAVARVGAMGAAQGAASPGGIGMVSASNLTQQVEGVFFYIDVSTGRRMMQLVQNRSDPLAPSLNTAEASTIASNHIDVYLDCVPNTEPVALPAGVGIAFISEVCQPSSGLPADRYIGFNTVNNGSYNKSNGQRVTGVRTYNDPGNIYGPANGGTGGVRWGDVILFDTTGTPVALRWGLRVTTATYVSNTNSTHYYFTAMGRLLYGVPDASAGIQQDGNLSIYPDLIPRDPTKVQNNSSNTANTTQVFPLRSAQAFVLFDKASYDSKGFIVDQLAPATDPSNDESNLTIFNDPTVGWDSPSSAPPGSISYARMAWLDNNTTALMVNRYNGTLIRAE